MSVKELEKRVGKLELVCSQLVMKIKELDSEKSSLSQRTLKVRDIAEICGVSVESLYKNKRYLLPNCAVADGSGNPSVFAWTREEFDEWNSKPLELKKTIFKFYRKNGKIDRYWEKKGEGK